MRERFEFYLASSVLKTLGMLPRPAARWAGASIVAMLFLIRPAWRRAALFNLRLAFPGWEESQRHRVIRTLVRNLGWLLAEIAHLPRLTRQNVERVIVLEEFENFAAAERSGKGVLLLTGHMGAWELSPFAHALYSRPIHFMVRPLDNPRVDALVARYRGLCGNQPIAKNQSARAALRVLRQGGAVGILADQNTAAEEEAVFVDFFGVPAATTTGVARLARRTGAAVVPAYSYWDASLRKYRLCYEPALALACSGDEEADIRAFTAQFNSAIEAYVRRFPDQWLWTHRRWKNRPPGEAPIYPDQKPS